MGVAQKTMFSISDRLAKFFGISGAPMEHNAIAKSKQTFFYKLGINGPGLTSFLQKSSWRVSSEKNILNSSVEPCRVESC